MPNKISLLTLDGTANWYYGKLLARKISSLYVFRLPERTKEKSKEGADNTIIESRTTLPCLFTSSQCVPPFSLSLFSFSFSLTSFLSFKLPSFLAFLSLYLVLSRRYVPVTRSDNNALLSPLFQNSLLGVEALCTRHLY